MTDLGLFYNTLLIYGDSFAICSKALLIFRLFLLSFSTIRQIKSSCKKSYCGKQIQLKLCNIIVLLLFHRNLYRILTYFGDNQRFVYGIRGCTIRCNRRAEILAISSIELHHFAIIKSREADDTIMGRSHNATFFYHIDIGTIIQVSINPIQNCLRLIRYISLLFCSSWQPGASPIIY